MNKKEELQKNVNGIENKMRDFLEEVTKDLGKIKEAFLPEPKEYKRYYPEVEEKYWFVDADGDTCISTWDNDERDWWRFRTMPLFRTEAEAIRYRDIHKTIMNIASKYPVEDGAECLYFAITEDNEAYCGKSVNLYIPFVLKVSENISDEINTALTTDDLLFYRSVT